MKFESLSAQDILDIDRHHIWHPYSSFKSDQPLFVVESAKGTKINLASGEQLVDGMSSWWSALHGYNHPELNKAVTDQTAKMAHVMFGGFTHEPAAKLASQLIQLSPKRLQHIFFCDSGSVAVEVAMKMAIQYWQALGQKRTRFMSLQKGYHGDTFAAMSVCDPVTGMHTLFSDAVPKQIFASQPTCRFNETWNDRYFEDFECTFLANRDKIAAVILEPIVQGTGGMHFYSPVFLKKVREITEKHGVPLIADEIATGLGRTGKLFACEHANVEPDIMCLGKTLSAGYLTLAATLCSRHIANTICYGDAGVFMHGPTYMANPLACAVASKNIELLAKNDWHTQIQTLEQLLKTHLEPIRQLNSVVDVRVLGGIGVVEMREQVDLKLVQPEFVKHGAWLRPFGKFIYTMPPYVSTESDIKTIAAAINATIKTCYP